MTVASRRPGDEAILRAAVAERLARAGRKGLARAELVAALDRRHSAGEIDLLTDCS